MVPKGDDGDDEYRLSEHLIDLSDPALDIASDVSAASAAFRKAVSRGRCPDCPGHVTAVVDSPGTFLCDTDHVLWTEQRYSEKVIDFGLCPFCGAPLVKSGRKGAQKRFKCRVEGRILSRPADAWDGFWREELGADQDDVFKAVTLWVLGWSTNRIAKEVSIRRNRLLRLFSKDSMPLAVTDAALEIKENVVYYCVWDSLRSRSRSGRMPFSLPPVKPWQERGQFDVLLDRIGRIRSAVRRHEAISILLQGFASVLVHIARGQFGRAQLSRYARHSVDHFHEILASLIVARDAGIDRRRRCFSCNCVLPAASGTSIDTRVERTLHTSGLCRGLREVFERVRRRDALAGLYTADASADPVEHHYESLARQAHRKGER